MNNLIVLNGNDNVGVSQFIIPEKTKIEGHDISTLDPIPFGHKVCLKEIKKGDPIIKYDQIIGFALNDIKPGEHVHSHNLEFREFKRDFKVTDKSNNIEEKADTFFNGILRDNGQVATRNYIGIVSTVNCSATVTKMIVEKIKYSEILKDYPNIDGIVPITHSTGCGMNTESEGMQIFQRTIDGFKNHPNFSHVFVIGLGCECAQVSLFDESLKQLNKALKTDPTNAQIYKLKALLYEALNDSENAIISWNKCIKYSKDKNMTIEAKIHLDYLNEF